MSQVKTLTIRSEGFDKLARDMDAVSRSATGMNRSTNVAGASVLSVERQFAALERSISPLVRAQQQLERGIGITNRALNQGAIDATRHGQSMAMLQQRYDAVANATKMHSTAAVAGAKATALSSHEMKNLGFQLNDAATMLASGSSPFQVMATQSGQVLQVLQGGQGGVSGSLKSLGGSLLGMLTPARLAFGGIAALTVAGIAAWNSYDNKIKDVQRSLNGLGAGTGLTSAGAFASANSSAARGNLGFSQALSGVSTFAGAGINKNLYEGLNEQAFVMSRGLGMTQGDAQQKLSDTFANPMAGLADLTKTFGPFGVEIEKNITLLQTTNRMEEAQAALYEALNEKLKNVVDTSGFLGRAWEAIKNEGGNAYSRLGAVGQTQTPIDQFRSASKNEQAAARFGNSDVVEQYRRQRIAAENALTAEELQAERKRSDVLRARQSYLDEENRKITDLASSSAQAITARTSADRLAIEQERLLKEARYDTAKTSTLAADSSRAYALAIAEATKAQSDYRRSSRDEAFSGGARNELEQFIRRTQIEMRDLGERTNVLKVPPPASTIADEQVRSQLKLGEEYRAGSTFNPSAISPFRAGTFGSLPQGSFDPSSSNMRDLAKALEGIEAAANRVVPAVAGARNPREITVGGTNPDKVGSPDSERVANFLKNKTEQMFYDYGKAIDANEAVLKTSIGTFGESTFVIAKENEATRIRNELIRFGIKNTDDYAEAIRLVSERQAKYAVAAEKEADRQKRVIDSMDFLRSSGSDVISSPLKALARGEDPAKAAQQAAQRMVERMIDMSTNSLIEGVLGKSGKPGGGLFGGLLSDFMGGGKPTNTPMMNVQASVVNIGGAGSIPGAGGGGNWLSNLFGGGSGGGGFDNSGDAAIMASASSWSANGNVFNHGNVVPFARGGLVGGPTYFPMANGGTGLMGESGPEAIMPLRRGSDGKLGVSGSGGGAGGVSINVINNNSSEVSTQTSKGPDGRVMVEFIIDKVKGRMAKGDFDGVNSARYGQKPKRVVR